MRIHLAEGDCMQMLKINTGTVQCKIQNSTQCHEKRDFNSTNRKQIPQGCYCAVTQHDSLCIFIVIGVMINTRTPKEWTERGVTNSGTLLPLFCTAGIHYPQVVGVSNQINLAYSPQSMYWSCIKEIYLVGIFSQYTFTTKMWQDAKSERSIIYSMQFGKSNTILIE